MANTKKNRRALDTVDFSFERGQVTALIVGSVAALGVVFLVGVTFGQRLTRPEDGAALAPAPAAQAATPPELTFHDALTSTRLEPRPEPPAPAPAPAARPASEREAPSVAQVAARAVVERAAVPLPPEPEPEVDAPSRATGAYSVQVASSRDEDDTRRLAHKLRDAGYETRIVPADIPGRGRWYRVRVGRFPSQEDAALKQAEIKVALNMTGLVVAD